MYQAKLLPLLDILKRNTYIRKIKLPKFKRNRCLCFNKNSNSDMSGNADANLIGHVLRQNSSITEVDISYHNVGIEGLISLSEGIKHNNTILKLDISGNYIGSKCVDVLINMIKVNNSLKEITIENMNIEFRGTKQIQEACLYKSNSIILNVNGNFVYEERLNVWTHILGMIMSM